MTFDEAGLLWFLGLIGLVLLWSVPGPKVQDTKGWKVLGWAGLGVWSLLCLLAGLGL